MPPNTPPSVNDLYQRALTLLKRGQFDAADDGLLAVLKARPRTPEASYQLGILYARTGRLPQAAAALSKALTAKPNEGAIWQVMGDVLARWGDPSTAKATRRLLNKAKLPPPLRKRLVALCDTAAKTPPALAQINALIALEDHAGALTKAEAAMAGKDADPRIALTGAHAANLCGQRQRAMDLLDRGIALDADSIPLRSERAALLQEDGQFEDARADLLHLTRTHPAHGQAYLSYAQATKFATGDPLIAQMETALARPDLSDPDRITLGFALSKAMEDSGQTARVFDYLAPANAALRAAHPYDVSTRLDEVAGLKASFVSTDFAAPLSGADSDLAPIFITGLPRSGTTLVEQILTCRKGVEAGGETAAFLPAVYQRLFRSDGSIRPLQQIPQRELLAMVPAFEQALEKKGVTTRLFTDKSIQTHLVLGIARLILPKAKLIVVRRDPRDMLLSIYKNMFRPGTHGYSTDLGDLAAYYGSFVEILDFWRDKMPGGFHEVWYEDLVSNPEEETRKLVAAAGFDWDDAFLSPHKNTRTVKTLSIGQVRQPIHQGSKQAWRRYETELQPLIEALGDLVER